jgi:hypothetical protein
MAIWIKQGYSTLSRYNSLSYIFRNSEDVSIDEKENMGLWTTKYIGNELLLYKVDFTRNDKVIYFKETDPKLIASFNDDGEYTTGDGLTFMHAVFDVIIDKNPIIEFLRDSMVKNECLYKLFFFDENFAERVNRCRRNAEYNVSMNVFENILNNGLSSLEKVFTGCSLSFFVENICKGDMGLQNDKKKLRQVLGLPSAVIDFLKDSTYSSLYGRFKELAENKDVNDTVFLVEYMTLIRQVENQTNTMSNGSRSAFVESIIDIALMVKSSMKVIINYLHSQQFYYNENSMGIMMPYSEAIAMRDYLAIAKKHGLEVDPLPSNLRAAHFYIQNNVCYADDEAKNEEFKKAVAKYKDLEYKGKTYSVVAPDSIAAMIDEGMQMHHCIANYVDLVCTGTIVLFLRKTENLKESFISFEVSEDGEFVQIKGKFDADIVETEEDSENNEVLKFLTKWREKKYEEVYGS